MYNTPDFAPRISVLFWRPGDCLVSCSNRDTLLNVRNRLSGSFMVDTGSYSAIWSLPLSNVNFLNDILTLDQLQWVSKRLDLTNFMSLIPSLTFTELWVVSIEHLQRGCGMPTGNALTISETWFRPFLGLAYARILETSFPELPCLFPTLHFE